MRRLRGQRAARPGFESFSGSLSVRPAERQRDLRAHGLADESRLGPAEAGCVVVDRRATFEVQVIAVRDRVGGEAQRDRGLTDLEVPVTSRWSSPVGSKPSSVKVICGCSRAARKSVLSRCSSRLRIPVPTLAASTTSLP